MSVVSAFLNSKNFSKLIIKGKDQGFISPEEINDAIPAGIVDAESIDEVIQKIMEAQLEVQSHAAEEEEDEEGIRLDGTEVIEETLSREEKVDLGRPPRIL